MRRIIPLLLSALLPLAALAAEAPAPHAAELATARELFTARRDAEAQAAFARLVAADPANHEAVYHLGRLAKRRNDWAAVAEHYRHCTELAPQVALYWADLGEAYGKLAGKAGVLAQLGLARRCRAALEKAVALAPDDNEYRLGLATYYEEAPMIAGGSRDKALAQTAEVAKRDPYTGAMATGGIHARAGNLAGAEAAYLAAAKLRPEATEPLAALGRLYADHGRHAEAFRQLDQVLVREPGHLPAAFQLGRVSAISGQRLADGEAALRRYLGQPAPTRGPATHAQAQFRLGEILVHRGERTAAREAFEAALQLEPGLRPAAEALRKLRP